MWWESNDVVGPLAISFDFDANVTQHDFLITVAKVYPPLMAICDDEACLQFAEIACFRIV